MKNSERLAWQGLAARLHHALLYCNFEEEDIDENAHEMLQQLWYEFTVGNAEVRS